MPNLSGLRLYRIATRAAAIRIWHFRTSVDEALKPGICLDLLFLRIAVLLRDRQGNGVFCRAKCPVSARSRGVRGHDAVQPNRPIQANQRCRDVFLLYATVRTFVAGRALPDYFTGFCWLPWMAGVQGWQANCIWDDPALLHHQLDHSHGFDFPLAAQ